MLNIITRISWFEALTGIGSSIAAVLTLYLIWFLPGAAGIWAIFLFLILAAMAVYGFREVWEDIRHPDNQPSG